MKIKFVSIWVTLDLRNPLYWFNYECALSEDNTASIPCIQVFYRDESFVISNHFGIGVHKLSNGGWPNFPHYSIGEDEHFEDDKKPILIFDEPGYREHEGKREAWRKENYPAEYEKLSLLRSLIKKNK